ncbi:MAG: PaaI family thioesterase, partial [Rhodospirillales bacterium]|nr:PaaI family thioesterase [Rhodospirillales bacterium]
MTDDHLPPPGGGWSEEHRGGYFTQLVGPIYICRDGLDAGESVRFGFRVRRDHCNPRMVCHGGMLAAVLDLVLACALRDSPDVTGPLPTISMSL